MEGRKLINILHLLERLKDTPRHSFSSLGRSESVAEHSWRAALMAYFLKDEFPEADIDKVILMCLVHDFGEAFTGDIPAFDKTCADEALEDELLYSWLTSLPVPYAAELTALCHEMSERRTLEARIYKAVDSLEAVIQHNEAPISSWSDIEYELNLTYG